MLSNHLDFIHAHSNELRYLKKNLDSKTSKKKTKNGIKEQGQSKYQKSKTDITGWKLSLQTRQPFNQTTDENRKWTLSNSLPFENSITKSESLNSNSQSLKSQKFIAPKS